MRNVLLILLVLFCASLTYGQVSSTTSSKHRDSTFANLGTPSNGSVRYCTDCLPNTSPCTGSGTGAFAERVAGAWSCGTSSAVTSGITNSTPSGGIPYTSDGSGNLAASPLLRIDANTVYQQNSTNAQVFRVYGVNVDGSNYSYIENFYDGAGTHYLRNVGLGSGDGLVFNVSSDNNGVLNISGGSALVLSGANGASAWRLNSTGLASDAAKIPLKGTGTGASQLSIIQTTPPVCSTNCGTSPTVTGSDTFMKIVLGTTPASGFLITFNGTWAAAPACTVQMGLAGMVIGKLALTAATTTTTVIVVTNGTAPSTGDIYFIHCAGLQ